MNAPDPVHITHKNIREIYEHEKRRQARLPVLQRIANRVARWAGTVSFIFIHLAVFAGWIAWNLTGEKFDPYPFVFLITTVSLEAILLQCFLLLSQNYFADEADRRHKLDLQINLLAERESTAALRLLDKIAEKLEIPEEERIEVKRLSDDTNPADVLEEIVRVEKKIDAETENQ